jgi:hypothetical protein
MNNRDLDSLLRTVRVPERREGYWDDFPRRVAVELREGSMSPPAAVRWLPRFAWVAGPTLACCLLGLWVGQGGAPRAVSRAIQHRNELCLRVAQLPDHFCHILRPGRGLEALVADAK